MHISLVQEIPVNKRKSSFSSSWIWGSEEETEKKKKYMLRRRQSPLFQHRISGCLFFKLRVLHHPQSEPLELVHCAWTFWNAFFFSSKDDKNRTATHFQLRHKKELLWNTEQTLKVIFKAGSATYRQGVNLVKCVAVCFLMRCPVKGWPWCFPPQVFLRMKWVNICCAPGRVFLTYSRWHIDTSYLLWCPG